jgi:peroxiredoxin
MRFLPFFLFLLLCFQGTGWTSGTSLIHGNAPDYRGSEIVLYRIADYISYTETEAGRTMVQENGDFSLELEVSEVTYLFAPLGVYRAYFFLEPGKTIELELPERRDKTITEKINPFFEEVFVHLAVMNEGDDGLNRCIMQFDPAYESLFASYVQGLVEIDAPEKIDSLIYGIESLFGGCSQNSFFRDYRNYRYGFLRHITLQQRARSLSDDLFLNQPVLYDNPAYMELFNQLYTKYFLFFGRTREGRRIYEDIGQYKSLSRLKGTLSSDDVLKDEKLLELVVLKGLHDGFYSADFSRKDLLEILDSLYEFTEIPRHKEIAGLIRAKVTKLLVGYDPPFFELPDARGDSVRLSDFLGKYVYLNFCTPASYSCLKEFEMLQWLKNKHSEYLEIVTILVDESLDTMNEFLNFRPYEWTVLFYDNQPAILKEYDVRAFPTYYLLDKDGKLILSPAPAPFENFELSLFRIMRDRREL